MPLSSSRIRNESKSVSRPHLLSHLLLFSSMLIPVAALGNPDHSGPHPSAPLRLGVNGAWDWVDLIKGLSAWNTVGTETAVTQDASGWPTCDAGMDFDERKNMPWRAPDAPGINEDLAGVYKLSLSPARPPSFPTPRLPSEAWSSPTRSTTPGAMRPPLTSSCSPATPSCSCSSWNTRRLPYRYTRHRIHRHASDSPRICTRY